MADMLNLIGYQAWVVPVLLLLPIVGAFLVVAAPASRARSISLAVALVEFIVSAGLWWSFLPEGGMQFTAALPWMPRWGVSYRERPLRGLLSGHQAHHLQGNPCMMVKDGVRAWRRAARSADGIEVQLGDDARIRSQYMSSDARAPKRGG